MKIPGFFFQKSICILTPPVFWNSPLLMTHHEEMQLNANHSPNPNPKGGMKVQLAPMIFGTPV